MHPKHLALLVLLPFAAGPALPPPAVAAPPEAPAPAGSSPAWRLVPTPRRGSPITAIAADRARGRLAIGDLDGVALRPRGGFFRRVARAAGVRDLHFSDDGVLWIAAVSGLWRLDPDGRLEERSPVSSGSTRSAVAVRSAGGVVVLATEGGAFASRSGRAWQRLGGPLSLLSVSALAVRERDDHVEAWLAAGSSLWRARVEVAEGGLAISARREDAIPGRPLGEEPVDLALDAGGDSVVVLYPRDLALRRREGGSVASAARRGATGALRPGWRVLSLPLPPEARARRIAFAGDSFFVAHDRGLVRATDLEGPWRRARPPLGTVSSHGAVALADGVAVATERGLFAAPTESTGAPASSSKGALPAASPLAHRVRGPAVRAVHRAALRHLDLGVEVDREAERGLAFRGWLPDLDLRFDVNDETNTGSRDDQAFITGETRFLRDEDLDRGREYEGGVTLRWELGRLAYDSDWDDLSRERRQRTTLRDDVLDEINQLYFERLRVLAERERVPSEDARRGELGLRAEELAAGLDAWTGGWFSGQLGRAFEGDGR